MFSVSLRSFERQLTNYNPIMLSLPKFGLSEYAENPRFWVF